MPSLSEPSHFDQRGACNRMRAIATPDPLTGASSLQFRVKNCRSRRTIALCSSSNQKMAPNLPKISSPGGIDAFLFDMVSNLTR
mgnify:FL=1